MPVDDTGRVHRRFVWLSDALAPGLLGVVGSVEIIGAGLDPFVVSLGTLWLTAGVLCARRAAPLAMPLVVGAIYALTPLLGFDVSNSAAWILVLAFTCLSTGQLAPRSRRLAGLACVLMCLAITVAGLAWFTDLAPNLLFGLIFSVGSWSLGVSLREALDRTRRMATEAERARMESALAAGRAAGAERDRISAELHDALAHALGAMVVRTSVARDLVRRDAAEAVAALRGVAQAGRDALGETGRLLRLLRDDRDELGLRLGTMPADSEPAVIPTEEVSPGPRFRRSDLLLPAFFGIVATAEIAWEGYRPLWASIGAFWLAVGVLCARRAYPLLMPVTVSGILVGARLLGAETFAPAATIPVTALACFAAGLHVPRFRAAAGLVSVLAALALAAVDVAAREALADVVLLIAFIAPWAVGAALRQTLERTRELAAEAERARLEQELEAERGASAERKRIARELHDVLANSLSVMIVQASLAADLVEAEPEAAVAALGEVERAGSSALEEIGRLLQLVKDDAGGIGTHPQHCLEDLPALADEYERAGLAVDLEVADIGSALPLGVELSAYRIVQEGLTNALKHAPGSPVHVRLARHDSDIAIEVRNGRAAAAALAVVPSRRGLVGLRERVSLFEGELDAGPTPDGGFVLAATLPLQESAA